MAPQEIRSCVYRGPFNDLLQTLNEVAEWRRIYGPVSARRKDQELILRFFALKDALNAYAKPLKQFLNDYMEENAKAAVGWLNAHREVFLRTITCAARHLPRDSFRPERGLNVAVTDAMLIGLARRIEQGEIVDSDQLGNAAMELSRQQAFRDADITIEARRRRKASITSRPLSRRRRRSGRFDESVSPKLRLCARRAGGSCASAYRWRCTPPAA